LLPAHQHSSPETTSGIYNRSFFWWLNTILRTGFQRIISEKDLFPIDHDFRSSTLTKRAQDFWDARTQTGTHALFWVILRANASRIAVGILPRLCLTGFRYAQPLLLARTVDFVSSNEADSIGWGLTGAFGIVFLGMAVASGSYYHMSYRFVTAVRGSLIGIIYAKTAELSITALDESAAVTLMSKDTG